MTQFRDKVTRRARRVQPARLKLSPGGSRLLEELNL
jgi:hypothetical protein